jgi:hypothetical protein
LFGETVKHLLYTSRYFQKSGNKLNNTRDNGYAAYSIHRYLKISPEGFNQVTEKPQDLARPSSCPLLGFSLFITL